MNVSDILAGADTDPDPAAITAAEVAVYRGINPPTRPITFAAPELGPCEWVTYALPFGAWRADLTREEAAVLSGGDSDVAERGAIGYEAICRTCGEIFAPDLTYPDGSGFEHYQHEEQQTECGGRGDLIGWW